MLLKIILTNERSSIAKIGALAPLFHEMHTCMHACMHAYDFILNHPITRPNHSQKQSEKIRSLFFVVLSGVDGQKRSRSSSSSSTTEKNRKSRFSTFDYSATENASDLKFFMVCLIHVKLL